MSERCNLGRHLAPYPTRRALLSATALLPLAACGDQPIFNSMFDVSRYLTGGLKGQPLTRKFVSDLPYATMRAQIGRGPAILIVLAEVRGSDYVWVTGDNIVIVTRAGRAMTVTGIDKAVSETVLLGADPLALGAHRIIDAAASQRIMNMGTTDKTSYTIDSVFEPLTQETISILELNFNTIKLRERNEARHQNWLFENTYWVDQQSGLPWKSRQYISRDFAPITLEMLKPPAV